VRLRPADGRQSGSKSQQQPHPVMVVRDWIVQLRRSARKRPRQSSKGSLHLRRDLLQTEMYSRFENRASRPHSTQLHCWPTVITSNVLANWPSPRPGDQLETPLERRGVAAGGEVARQSGDPSPITTPKTRPLEASTARIDRKCRGRATPRKQETHENSWLIQNCNFPECERKGQVHQWKRYQPKQGQRRGQTTSHLPRSGGPRLSVQSPRCSWCCPKIVA